MLVWELGRQSWYNPRRSDLKRQLAFMRNEGVVHAHFLAALVAVVCSSPVTAQECVFVRIAKAEVHVDAAGPGMLLTLDQAGAGTYRTFTSEHLQRFMRYDIDGRPLLNESLKMMTTIGNGLVEVPGVLSAIPFQEAGGLADKTLRVCLTDES